MGPRCSGRAFKNNFPGAVFMHPIGAPEFRVAPSRVPGVLESDHSKVFLILPEHCRCDLKGLLMSRALSYAQQGLPPPPDVLAITFKAVAVVLAQGKLVID